MTFEWMIAVRYFRAGGMQSVLTVLGVSVGVSVFLFIASLIGGVQENLIEQVIGSISQVTLEPLDNDPLTIEQITPSDASKELLITKVLKYGQHEAKIGTWQPIIAELDKDADLKVVSPSVSGPGFAIRGDQIKPISFRGVMQDRANGIIDLKQKLVRGEYDISGQNCVIGIDLAKDLGVELKGKIKTRSSKSRELIFNVAGIFDSGQSQ